MSDHGSLEASASILRVGLHREGKRAGLADRLGCTVAISREVGTPAGEVSRAVGAHLRWNVYDRELIQEIARELRVDVCDVERVDERHLGWLEECAEWFLLPNHHVSESRYANVTARMIERIGRNGQAVIVGRGSVFLLPSSNTLRVRLVAPWEDRVTSIQHRRGIGRRQAERDIGELTRRQSEFIREHFHCDVTDPRHFDLVLNTSRWSIGECRAMIVESLDRLHGARQTGGRRLAVAQ